MGAFMLQKLCSQCRSTCFLPDFSSAILLLAIPHCFKACLLDRCVSTLKASAEIVMRGGSSLPHTLLPTPLPPAAACSRTLAVLHPPESCAPHP